MTRKKPEIFYVIFEWYQLDRARTRKLSVLPDLDCCRPRHCLVIFVRSPKRSALLVDNGEFRM